MDDANYLKNADQVRLNICRHESSNDGGVSGLLSAPVLTRSSCSYGVVLAWYFGGCCRVSKRVSFEALEAVSTQRLTRPTKCRSELRP
jgi:hypothetical protein